mmetsp:Transcript_138728/g.386871  ORF Transcript_138728/g.386871 Transcript_138728/m.386871 type:complete len:227 (-) Transcript_138728:1207-1887(-)
MGSTSASAATSKSVAATAAAALFRCGTPLPPPSLKFPWRPLAPSSMGPTAPATLPSQPTSTRGVVKPTPPTSAAPSMPVPRGRHRQQPKATARVQAAATTQETTTRMTVAERGGVLGSAVLALGLPCGDLVVATSTPGSSVTPGAACDAVVVVAVVLLVPVLRSTGVVAAGKQSSEALGLGLLAQCASLPAVQWTSRVRKPMVHPSAARPAQQGCGGDHSPASHSH